MDISVAGGGQESGAATAAGTGGDDAAAGPTGGYNNRAGEGPFGPLPFWIGPRRMAAFALAWEAFVKET